jgi:threonine/homoserine/homoserine lactone efflux protein
MVLNLVILGLAIALEPLTLVAFVLILSAQRGTWKGLAFILGWMACLVVVIAAVVHRGRTPRPLRPPWLSKRCWARC